MYGEYGTFEEISSLSHFKPTKFFYQIWVKRKIRNRQSLGVFLFIAWLKRTPRDGSAKYLFKVGDWNFPLASQATRALAINLEVYHMVYILLSQ